MPYQSSSSILQPVSAWSESQQVLKTAFDKVTLSRPNPLKSFREFEDLRHRIVYEAGVGKLVSHTNFWRTVADPMGLVGTRC